MSESEIQPPPIINSLQSSQAPKQSRFKLRISPIAAIPAVLALVILMAPLLLSGTDADRTAYAYGAVAGSWGARVVGALVIAWLVALPLRGSRVATTITFSILVVLCPMGYSTAWMNDLNLPRNQGTNNKAIADFDRNESDRMRELRDDFADDGQVDLDRSVESMDARISEMERAANSVDQREARVMRASATVMREIQHAQAEYVNVTNELMGIGGIDMTIGETTLESIDRRIELAQGLIQHNAVIIELFDNMRSKLEDALLAEGIPEREAKDGAVRLADKANIPMVLRVRRLDKAVFASGVELLTIFRSHHGRWAIEDGMVVFDEDVPDEVIDECNALFQSIDENASELLQAQGKALGVNAPPLDVGDGESGSSEGGSGP